MNKAIDYQLLNASRRGDLRTCRALIKQGADVHAEDIRGQTALHWRVKPGYKKTCMTLLTHGANPLDMDKSGKTALDLAINEGHQNCIGSLRSAMATQTARMALQEISMTTSVPVA